MDQNEDTKKIPLKKVRWRNRGPGGGDDDDIVVLHFLGERVRKRERDI